MLPCCTSRPTSCIKGTNNSNEMPSVKPTPTISVTASATFHDTTSIRVTMSILVVLSSHILQTLMRIFLIIEGALVESVQISWAARLLGGSHEAHNTERRAIQAVA